jgi:hypothetical protein
VFISCDLIPVVEMNPSKEDLHADDLGRDLGRSMFTFEHKGEIVILSPWPFCNLSRTSVELTK